MKNTLARTSGIGRTRLGPGPEGLVDAERREWTLAMGDGSFAMGTVSGLATRRYHALLVASQAPPVSRARLVAACDERVSIGNQSWTLTPMLFVGSDESKRDASVRLVSFEHAPGVCAWRFELVDASGSVAARVDRVLRAGDDAAACDVSYTIDSGSACELVVTPLLALSDFHELHAPGSIAIGDLKVARDGAALTLDRGGIRVRVEPEGLALRREGACVWRNFVLIEDRSRGQDCVEDLYAPCTLSASVPSGDVSPRRVGLRDAALTTRPDLAAHLSTRESRLSSMLAHALRASGDPEDEASRDAIETLVHAADAFVVRRETPIAGSVSVIAGYPWFSDWGRDTMISLEGLMLVTGRFDEALRTLRVFAAAQSEGLIPNRFDDRSGPTHYNTVDASLWFVHAIGRWAHWSGEDAPGELIDAARRVVEGYTKGTRYAIGVDPSDGLVFAGDETTQLTWMDAQRGGVTFTPRHGKAVEINALWVQALATLGALTGNQELLDRADDTRASFGRVFGDGPRGGLKDTHDDETLVRPNQVFACSLDRVGLDAAAAKRVVELVTRELATPVGLRTLAPGDEGYEPWYTGTLMDRDRAYHNGTVWPWLLGPLCEGRMRSAGFDDASRAESVDRLVTLAHESVRVGAGSIHEIYDADPSAWRADASVSHRPDGCPAQAWSIAETLRVLVLALGSRDGDA